MSKVKVKNSALSLLMIGAVCGASELAAAKTLNLPEGIGLWSYSYRTYDSMSTTFDKDGYLRRAVSIKRS